MQVRIFQIRRSLREIDEAFECVFEDEIKSRTIRVRKSTDSAR
jgi:hypothetical protein